MGVPKFYRWISERYPCLSQVVKDYQIPEFDCLYLDMNGIIHVCSHPNDDDPHFRIKEEEIFANIFHYVEILFRIIKPQQHFFMAVDGVAPRAKMNQQRGRRFRTARESEENVRKALEKGQVLPSEERFDSNCITPGTDFMARLQEQLKYFVNMKISTDPLWQKCTVYLSGHDVPGEGEHKIMDFIRYQKSQENYSPNTRHCLYGLDADLVMLGLSCHEPHFALLREEVRFGKQAKRTQKAEETTFHLLHLSLLREYLGMEFADIKDQLTFDYDLERIIDDWILMGFLVGNDFVPNLPNFHIDADALPYLYKIYKEVLPRLDGYLHDGGFLNLPRFKVYLDALSKLDEEKFEDTFCDLKWLESKTSTPRKGPPSAAAHTLNKTSDSANASLISNKRLALVAELYNDSDSELSVDGGSTFFDEFELNKKQYYLEKFNLDVMNEECVQQIACEYIRAIQWILHYYFNGCQSWSWYYPYHYAPYISDLKKQAGLSLEYDLSSPFKPFEQLLAVLPAASKKLLPKAFQSLMVLDTSPIIEYYPVDFKTDLNGKRQDWEAVVLVPFIDEDQLLKAMQDCYPLLNPEEQNRNSFGETLMYTYSTDVNYKLSSSYPGVFRDVNSCRASCESIDRDAFRISKEDIRKGLCQNVEMQTYFSGFPTMTHVKYAASFVASGVKVFQQNSRKDNAIVAIHGSNFEEENVEVCSNQLLGKTVFVDWPYLVEAKVTSVFNRSTKYKMNSSGGMERLTMSHKMQDNYEQQLKWIKSYHMERKGINIGDVAILVEAAPIKGKRYVHASKGMLQLEKQWATHPLVYASNTLVENLRPHAEADDRQLCSMKELFPIGSECFMMAPPHYGCSGEVLEVDQNAGRVKLSLNVKAEPDLSFLNGGMSEDSNVTYFPSYAVAQKLRISPNLLSRITGSVFVDRDSMSGSASSQNLGLRLKFSGKNREVLGYARRGERGWMYSNKTTAIIEEYAKKYPEVFETLAALSQQDRYIATQFHFNRPSVEVLKEISAWLESLPSATLSRTPCGSTSVGESQLSKVIDAVNTCKTLTSDSVTVRVKPHVLFKHEREFGSLTPDPEADFQLCDRIVNVRHSNAVPVGLRGTIVGMVKDETTSHNFKDPGCPMIYEILFDDTFLGALKGRANTAQCQYLSPHALLNLSYGLRKSGASGRTAGPNTNVQSSGSHSSRQGGAHHAPPRSESKGDRAPRRGQRHTTTSPPQDNEKTIIKLWKDLQLNKTDNHTTSTESQHKPSHGTHAKGRQQQTRRRDTPQKDSNLTEKKTEGDRVDKEGSEVLRNLLDIKRSTPQQSIVNPMASPSFRPPRPPLQGPAAFLASLEGSTGAATTAQGQQFNDVLLSPAPTDSSNSASAALQTLCYHLAFPAPHYVYSATGQGIHAVIVIGPMLRYGGAFCSDRHQAAESAAMFALASLQQQMPMFAPPPFGFRQPMMPMMPQQQTPFVPPLPHQQNLPSMPLVPPSNQQSFSNPTSQVPVGNWQQEAPVRQQQPGGTRRDKPPAAKNFVPHQVALKTPQSEDTAVTPSKDDAVHSTHKDPQTRRSPSTKNQAARQSQQKTMPHGSADARKQRLLAPSFFGAKKA